MSKPRHIKVSVFMAKSLDGFIARPDGDVAWLDEMDPLPAGDDAGFGAFFENVDVMVMGRGSFEKVLTFDEWHYGDKPIVVMSKSLIAVPEHRQATVTLSAATPLDLVARLEVLGYAHIYLDGGKVIQSFLREGLVDEMTLTTIPRIIGTGIPLFGELDHDIRLQLVNSKSWKNGMVQSVYRITHEL